MPQGIDLRLQSRARLCRLGDVADPLCPWDTPAVSAQPGSAVSAKNLAPLAKQVEVRYLSRMSRAQVYVETTIPSFYHTTRFAWDLQLLPAGHGRGVGGQQGENATVW